MSYYALIASVSARARLREGEAMKERATKRVGRAELQWVSGLSFIHARCKMLMAVLSCGAFMGNRETDRTAQRQLPLQWEGNAFLCS